MPLLDFIKEVFKAMDGGFWGLLVALGLIGLFALKEQRLSVIALFFAFLIALAAVGYVYARESGLGQTRPPAHSQILIPKSASLGLEEAYAQEAIGGLKDWNGWFYVGVFDPNQRSQLPGQAYVEVVGVTPSTRMPQRGDQVKLLRPGDIYGGPPQFSHLRLRWMLGSRLTESPLPVGFILEIIGECSQVLGRDTWCPTLAKPTLIPNSGLLPDFPLGGSWLNLSQTYETHYKPSTLQIQPKSPNTISVPRTDIVLIFTRPVDKEPFRSQATLAMVGVGKDSKISVLGTKLVVGISTQEDMVAAYNRPERQRFVELGTGRRVPCFAYQSRGISFVVDDRVGYIIIETWIFKPESYDKFASLTC